MEGKVALLKVRQYYMFHQSPLQEDLGIIKTGDKIKIDLNKRRVDVLMSNSEFKRGDQKENLNHSIIKHRGKNYQD